MRGGGGRGLFRPFSAVSSPFSGFFGGFSDFSVSVQGLYVRRIFKNTINKMRARCTGYADVGAWRQDGERGCVWLHACSAHARVINCSRACRVRFLIGDSKKFGHFGHMP